MKMLDDWMGYEPGPMPDTPVIVEVGAYNLVRAHKLRKLWPNAFIDIDEAAPENFATLTSAALPGVRAYHAAVTDHDGTATLYRYPCRDSHSLLARHAIDADLRLVGEIAVDAVSVPTMIDRAGEYIDLLLLNCEGAEIDILHAIAACPDAVGQIAVGFHAGKCYPLDAQTRARCAMAAHYDARQTRKKNDYWLFTRKAGR